MDGRVLVAYASKYGSTGEVAEAVATTLRAAGAGVDVQNAAKVRCLEGYEAVVLGAPLYFGAWHKDAFSFLARHRDGLLQRPVAIFALGPTRARQEEEQAAYDQLRKEMAKEPWLGPVDVRVFGGKYDPSKLRFPDTLIASLPASPLHGQPASDVRDWAAIEAWAKGLPTRLAPVSVETQPAR